MKIAVIGGGSTYTPELVEGFARRADVLPVDELVLHDVSRERLDVVGGLAGRILRASGWPGRLTLTTGLDGAVEGARAVLVQLRVGGQAARLVDETLPHGFDRLGQETTGPGGFAKALRTVPVVLGIADRVRALAGPETWIVDFTNPVGIVTRALLDAGHRAIGLCNVAIGFQRRLAARLGVVPEQVRLGHAGLNHLSWIRSVTVDGAERLPDLLRGDHLAWLADEIGLPADLLRTLDAIPSYYLHYFYCEQDELRAQRTGPARADEVMRLEAELLALYSDPALDHKPAQLEQRGGAYYSEAAAALVTSLLTGDGAHHYVNVRNVAPGGEGVVVEGLPPEAVVEVPATVGLDGARPVPVPPLPPEMLGLVQHVTAYETLAVEAALTGRRDVALRALLANPLVRDWDVSTRLFDALVDANRPFLPAFGDGDGDARRG
ncbi:MAG: 6-phospho-beta-glucosidase [Actinomycetota bacterium]|nr:6-phospho-beta-glucosidase [Actinomycetota bacterium]